jgi:YHS domain-containing protein
MTVDETAAQHETGRQGQTYCFCAPGGEKAFEADPVRYLRPDYRPST